MPPLRVKKGIPISQKSGTVRHLARFQRLAKSPAVCGELAPVSFPIIVARIIANQLDNRTRWASTFVAWVALHAVQ